MKGVGSCGSLRCAACKFTCQDAAFAGTHTPSMVPRATERVALATIRRISLPDTSMARRCVGPVGTGLAPALMRTSCCLYLMDIHILSNSLIHPTATTPASVEVSGTTADCTSGPMTRTDQ